MYYPDLNEVKRLAEEYNLIPVMRTLMADTETPIRIFQHLYDQPYAFLLESVEGGAKWARYSFLGMNPFLIARGKKGRFEVLRGDGTKTMMNERPIEAMRRLLSAYKSPRLDHLPPFTGGAVGFFGYDLLQYYEKLPAHREDDLRMDDIHFMFADQLIVFDHFKQQLKIIANVHVPSVAPDSAASAHNRDWRIEMAYEEACGKIERMIAWLKTPHHAVREAQGNIPDDVETGTFSSNMTKQQFMDNVEKAKEYIKAGDIFQVVLSQRFEAETHASPLHVYRVLRTINPSPYMYLLKLDEEVIVGTSPELLVRVEGNRVQTRPIAGTRPRGQTVEEDLRLEQDLLADEKERAEHVMLVDLGRNDLGKVCKSGSIRCDSYMEIERYSHVMHIVSNISGELKPDKDFFDAFLSCLPAGTVSGAPKIRAMEIIAELENEARGAYAGAIGYLGFSGNLDTCITIRTIIFKHGKAYIQAGAGIVYDSVPEREYEETVNKAKALLKSIRLAEKMFPLQPRHAGITNQDYFIEEV